MQGVYIRREKGRPIDDSEDAEDLEEISLGSKRYELPILMPVHPQHSMGGCGGGGVVEVEVVLYCHCHCRCHWCCHCRRQCRYWYSR